jgi:hypothetical protein
VRGGGSDGGIALGALFSAEKMEVELSMISRRLSILVRPQIARFFHDLLAMCLWTFYLKMRRIGVGDFSATKVKFRQNVPHEITAVGHTHDLDSARKNPDSA